MRAPDSHIDGSPSEVPLFVVTYRLIVNFRVPKSNAKELEWVFGRKRI
jgi:hypothetical protein